jgi:hypothetical protein
MLIVAPVPDASVIFQERRTFWLPPMVTELGAAKKELITGDGHAVAVTVTCATEVVPQPFVTVRV